MGFNSGLKGLIGLFNTVACKKNVSVDICPLESNIFMESICLCRRSQLPRDLRRRSAAAPLLRSWVRIPPGAWIFVCCECRVLSGRSLCDKQITCPEESYRLCCVVVCDLETSWMRRPWPNGDCRAKRRCMSKLLKLIEEFLQLEQCSFIHYDA
jgi:hypothetical protein